MPRIQLFCQKKEEIEGFRVCFPSLKIHCFLKKNCALRPLSETAPSYLGILPDTRGSELSQPPLAVALYIFHKIHSSQVPQETSLVGEGSSCQVTAAYSLFGVFSISRCFCKSVFGSFSWDLLSHVIINLHSVNTCASLDPLFLCSR